MSPENEAVERSDDVAAAPPTDGAPPWYKRPKVKKGFIYAGIFVIGCAVGSIVTSHAIFHAVHRTFRNPERMAEKMLAHMSGELGLTVEQTEKLRGIVTDWLSDVGDTLTSKHDRLQERVNEILTPDQRKVFEERVLKMRCRFFGRHGPGCGHGGDGRPSE